MRKDLEWLKSEFGIDVDNIVWRRKLAKDDGEKLKKRLWHLADQLEEHLPGITFGELNADVITVDSPFPDEIKPDHYKGENGRDLIDSWKDTMTPEEFRGAMKGLISRYHMRYDRKNGVIDLDKANECIRRLKEWELERCNTTKALEKE